MKRVIKPSRTREAIQAVQELRRSSAAQPHANKKAYSRKIKHSKTLDNY